MGVPALASFPSGSGTKSAAPTHQRLRAPGCFFPNPSGKRIYKFAARRSPCPPGWRAILLHFVGWADSPRAPLLSTLESPEVRWSGEWRPQPPPHTPQAASEESGQPIIVNCPPNGNTITTLRLTKCFLNQLFHLILSTVLEAGFVIRYRNEKADKWR